MILSRRFPFLKLIGPYVDLAAFVAMIFFEVTFFPEFFTVPEVYSSLFLCCALVPIWRTLSAIIPAPWVAWFTWEAAYNSVCSAGTKVRAYVLDVYHRF